MKKINISSSNLKKIKISFGSDPDHDWVILCVAFFIILLAISLWSTVLFFSLKKESIELDSNLNAPSVSNTALINTKTLSNLLLKYDEKQKTFDNLKTTKLEIGDPSL